MFSVAIMVLHCPEVHRRTPFAQRTLANGLTVVVEERRSVPVVAVNLWYDVGSRHEQAHQRGLAHLFEHLMFQGSTHVAAGEHAAILEAVGARFNATTSFDRTNYFETVPVHMLPTALWLEADRMATMGDALSQTEFDAQRAVVKNERLQTMVEVPYGEAILHMMANLLPAGHPYAILPIGRMEHLDAATLQDLRTFFDVHYAPDNAVLSIVGDVEADDAFALAETYFGPIPRGPGSPRPAVATLPPLEAPTRLVVESDVPNRAVYRAWRIPPLSDESYTAFEIASTVLGRGPGSRLQTDLVRTQHLALNVEADAMGLAAGNSVFFVNTLLPDETTPDAAIAAVDAHLLRLIEHGITDDEFASAVARRERALLESMDAADGRADRLSRAHTLFGDAGRADEAVDLLRRLTPADVQAAAQAWLTPDASAIVVYEPRTTKETDR